MRDKYALYLLKLLKEHEITSINIQNIYEIQNDEHNICFYETELKNFPEDQAFKKCWIFANTNSIPKIGFKLKTLFGRISIRFNWNWKKLGAVTISMEKISDKLDPFLSSIFIQMLFLVDNGNDIWFDGEIFMKKNSTYEHILQSDLL